MENAAPSVAWRPARDGAPPACGRHRGRV